MSLDETDISAAIVRGYSEKLPNRLTSDVLIVGTGPAGLTAATILADSGWKVTLVDRRLTPGGGVWGGAMAMNEVVVQPDAVALLDQFGVRHRQTVGGLHRADAIELAAALTLHAVQAGAVLFNLVAAEDLCVHGGRVTGVVINRTDLSASLPIDPLTLRAPVVVDGTGHEAALVGMLRRRGLIDQQLRPGEGPMNAEAGERFTVERGGRTLPRPVGLRHGGLRHVRRTTHGADLRRHDALGPMMRGTDQPARKRNVSGWT